MNETRRKRFTANKKTRKRQQRANFNRVVKKVGTKVEQKLGAIVTHEAGAPVLPRHLQHGLSAKFAYTMPYGVVVAVR